MNWAAKRKIVYAVAVIIFSIVFAVYQARGILFPTPTCIDQKQNGFESGIDCGGSCALRCEQEVVPVSVEWSRAIPVSSDTYDFAAMLANRNTNSAPLNVEYQFTAYNKAGEVILSLRGETLVPADGDFPVIVQNIELSEQPYQVVAHVSQPSQYAVSDAAKRVQVRVKSTRYEGGATPRVYVVLDNLTQRSFLKLPLRVVAYDEYNNAVAVGESIVPSLEKEEEKEIIFTWPEPFSTTPTKLRAYPVLSPFQ